MFLEVARAGSFTAASKSTGISKSTLSEKIQSLEDELGTTLMVRTTRSLSLTDAGEEYLQRIASGIDQILNAREELKQTRLKPRGKIRVSLLPNLANTTFTERIAEFLKEFPEISVELDFSERVVNLLEEGFDVCVRAGQPEDSSLLSKRIRRDHSILVASSSYLRKRGEPRSVTELKTHELVNWHSQRGVWHLKSADNRNIKVDVNGRISANNPQSIVRIVAGGHGIGLLPRELCTELIAERRLIQILPEWGSKDFHIYIVYPEQKHLSAKLKVFISWLEKTLKQS
ncbi:LysR family transcriptional regulator [bacterium]|nr:LysR family transcriptional regulator [bacterium]